ncbi:MAG: 1-(5-phosphoribosyl)-5-[(5-phosphoribosylamino)methylideneamino]imidazole-4-carboxamide isomerase [Campylobacterales bacterium]
MDILPAIDLKDNRVVRLKKGELSELTEYGKTPLEFAHTIENMGAQWLHLVDLDGAFSGESLNFNIIEEIAKNTNLKIEVGGGIRDESKIKAYMNLGVNRVILGSIALKKPEFAIEMAKKYNVAVGIDSKDGKVAIEGWKSAADTDALEFAEYFKKSSIEAIICTDISRDGMMEGINIAFTENIAKKSEIYTIASGGVKGIEDIISLKRRDSIGGVIIGKAFYEGKIDLKEAIAISQR